MRRKSYIILLLCVMAIVSKAQIVITTPYEFAVGVSGGTTFSSVAFTPRVLQSMRMGLTMGVTGRMTMGENVGLQLELNYSQQGWKERYETEDGKPLDQYKYSRLLNYVQLPFHTRVQFGGEKVKGFVLAGPQIGYMIGESTGENLNGESPGRQNAQHGLLVQKKFEWGISGGIGIEIRTGIGYFTLDGRYLYSLGDIYNTKREDPFSKASGQTITAKIAFLIPLRHSK